MAETEPRIHSVKASESLPIVPKGSNSSSIKKQPFSHKPIASYAANASNLSPNCIVCKREKYPLSVCSCFKLLPHDQKFSTLKSNGACMNCLKPGHFVKYCKSLHHCKACQKPHHTLLHIDNMPTSKSPSTLPSLTIRLHSFHRIKLLT